MFKPILALIAALAAALPLLFVTTSEAAADDRDVKRVVTTGKCVHASGWSNSGSFSYAVASDSVVWKSRRHLHVDYSRGKAMLLTCSRARASDGGKIGIRHTWVVEGTRVGSCEIGWGGSCTVSDYAEKSTRASGWRPNRTGQTSFDMGQDDIYARSTDSGRLDAYTHKVFVRFISPSGNAETSTTATIRFRRGD